jgi:Putative prokaryotic signal transducing protein
VIKVFEDFDFSRVGRMQSLLEAQGIRTFIRNQYGSSVMGEVPFVEVVPQLFVLHERDVPLAIDLLRLDRPRDTGGSDWICPECGVDMEAHFDRCWKCGLDRDKG